MKPEDIRLWAKQREEAARRELAELRASSTEDSVRASFELFDIVGEVSGWPPPISERDRREDEAMYETWARLRKRMRPA